MPTVLDIYILFLPYFQKEVGYIGYFTLPTLVLSLLTILFFLIIFNSKTTSDWNRRILKLFKIFGDFSFGIYLSHRPISSILSLFIREILELLELNTYQSFLYPVLYIALVPPLSICLTYLLWNIPLGEYIIGRRPQNALGRTKH